MADARTIDTRATEPDQPAPPAFAGGAGLEAGDRALQDDRDRVVEQFIGENSKVEVTRAGATVAASARVGGRHAYVDGLYYRVTERSPSTPHPGAGDTLYRITERSGSRIPGELDYRGAEHQLLGGATVAAFTAMIRVHDTERHFLLASRSGHRFLARSDFRKTRAA